MNERYPFKEAVICHPGKWTTMERGIQYLKELAMLEVVYGDLNNEQLSKHPDEVHMTHVVEVGMERTSVVCQLTGNTGKMKRVQQWMKWLANSNNTNTVSLPPLSRLWRNCPGRSSDLKNIGPTFHLYGPVSQLLSQRSSAQERGYRGYTPQGTQWFYLHDHGEDMRKWDGKPTSTLEARVRELQGKTITKGGSSRKIAAPVSSGQFPRQSQRADLTLDFNEGAPDSYVQEMGNEYYDQDKGGPASSQVEERDNRVYCTVWIRWPGTSGPQEYKALVDTSAQCTLMPSSYIGAEPICISGGGSQQLTVLEAEVSLSGNEWQKHPILTGPEAPCILGIDYLRRGYFKDPKGYRWAFGIAALETEEIKQLSTLPGLSEDPSVVGLLRAAEQQVPIAITTVHRRQYCTNRDSLIPIHELIHRLESQGVISKTRSPFNSPIWPVRKSNGEWRLTVHYHGLNEVTPLLSAAVPDMLELQYELESKAAKWYATSDIANAFFSIPLAAECRPQFVFTWRGVQYTWNIVGWVENLVVKVRHVDAHVPKSWATEEHQSNPQVDQAAKFEVVQVDLNWQNKGELFIARWAHDTSGHQGRDARYRCACDRGVDLTMDTIAQVIHECETCAAIKQAKQLKPLWYGGRWLKYKYGEAWQIDYITLPQTRQGKRHVLTMVEEPLDGWKRIPCPMPPPGTLSWALKSESYGDMEPQKGLSQTTGLIFETTS
ncbi:LOW QUALITY PROTEIN: hypothetical protein QYF61_024343 [Mycteria americana]|uniref:Uncharacterized protein n=1 Tax=Mycteria americana TaxID=33587 RepID=A0AAN7MBT5_MYCAM|nr:LOW QUALITY PROTEIN: hypothetical protein QYF61_024343 [Mycteria americana]